ncbi:MAG: GAF domain-containing protein, partial [Candidatus Omnitrophica bacterium]|nr:GAF domain-containing protein [Candidatus Omnitrophota bacterium]
MNRRWRSPFGDLGLERKLTLAFGFMSFIPILFIVWAMASHTALDIVIYPIAASMFIGYFFVVRRTIQSVLMVSKRVRAATSSGISSEIPVTESNEIGELARAFNRITQDLERKIEELEASRQLVKKLLTRIGAAIVSYEGIDNVLNLVVENTVVALEAQMGSLLLVDGQNQELYVKTTWSSNGFAPVSEKRIKMQEGIAGLVAREGHTMRGVGSPTVLGFENGHAKEGAILCVPLKLRDRPIGVVMVLRENAERVFNEDEESLMGSIASQMAVAIENYRLNLDVERTYVETIMALALAVEAKDPYSAGHSKR